MARYGSGSSSRGLIAHGPPYAQTFGGIRHPHNQQPRNASRLQQLLQLQKGHLPLLLLLLVAVWAVLGCGYIAWNVAAGGGGSGRHRRLPEYMYEPVLVSYAYFEKDPIQVG